MKGFNRCCRAVACIFSTDRGSEVWEDLWKKLSQTSLLTEIQESNIYSANTVKLISLVSNVFSVWLLFRLATHFLCVEIVPSVA